MSTDLTQASIAPPGEAALTAAWRALAAAFAVFIVVKVVLLPVLGVNTQYLMDEYVTAGHAMLVDRHPYQDVWPNRTILYAYFYRIAFWLGADSVEVMRFARIETVGLALISLAVVYAIARALGRSRLEALLVLGVALSFSSFMERAFMVRPEPLALFFGLVALWTVVRRPDRLAACLVAGLWCGAAFLTTQKAVYFDLALGVALVGEGLLRRSLTRAVAAGALLVLGWAVVLVAYVGAFSAAGAAPAEVLDNIFLGSATENAARGHVVYDNLRYFVWQTFSRNIPQYVICLFGLLIAVATIRRRSAAERIALIFTAVIAALVYGFHAAPWPYNFILAIPFLALWSPLVLEPFRQASARTAAFVMLAVLAALVPSFARNVNYLDHGNAVQNETLRQAEPLLAPGEVYFDGVHMVVTRAHATRLWLQRSALLRILDDAKRGDFSVIESILAEQPKIWILNYRTNAIATVLAPFLTGSYVRIAPNILIAGIALDGPSETVFENRWGGTYNLRAADGTLSQAALFVDGRKVRGPIGLPPGRHSLRPTGAGGRFYLLPADADLSHGISLPQNQKALFPDAHTF